MKKNLLELPENGIPREEVLNFLNNEMQKDDIDAYSGKAFGLCYLESEEHSKFIQKVYSSYMTANALNPMAYPSLVKMESETIAMTAWMLNGTRKTTGTLTSGGTESILMAIKAHRDWGRDMKSIKSPEMIIPETVHPAFHKAAHYFGVNLIQIPIRKDYRADIEKVKDKINENTILLVGSAPCYPYGVIDPIEDLGRLAIENNIGCHVDACLGGYFLPWIEKLGYPISSNWDFRVPGVTSISLDLHKYGYAAKPASSILYKSDSYRKYQFFISTDWCGGIYGSPSAAGSRPGGAIASAWATMKALGQKGYMKASEDVMQIAKKMIKGIDSVDGLHIIGDPEMCIYAYTFDQDLDFDFFKFIDLIEHKGSWMINRMQNPPAAHHMTSRVHKNIVTEFLNDLEWAMEKIKTMDESEKVEGQAAMYGMMQTFNNKEKINEIVRDILLKQYSYVPRKKKD
ncbi:MAG: aminotransferase class V-fold PLP-dependent enzyme [Candidatus Lokiarchaeota archaeon]|nr:aminotransferase class V-fold PLP-dependent enzyme [Candidatus Lokiarchaeota archaeon]MBD3200125.1 aminotransferase class V-fold PLP-dependent enzyme [Candidatus Lokiarchaeota archaeon]